LTAPFADRLIGSVRKLGPLCVGIDPHETMVPALFGKPGPDSARAFGLALVERCAGKAAIVKPQAGFFERWGSPGLAALEDVCRAAKKAGLLVLLDAKRGDLGTTAEGYAEGYLGADARTQADALTVNPYMGLDGLAPFVHMAEKHGKGVVVLARTSNPGSKDFQQKLSDGEPMFLHVVGALKPMIARLKGRSGWSGLMLVTGATGPTEMARIRTSAPDALFLVPGYGAQGATAKDAMAGFVKGPNGLEGGVVNASRSVSFPAGAQGAADARRWERAIDLAILAAQEELVAATRV
jgi:orotidine-5'-phosphate decarboxylase